MRKVTRLRPEPTGEDVVRLARESLLLVVLAWLAVLSACASRIAPLPVVTAPKFPEFLQPVVPPALANTASAIAQNRGWVLLQAGDLKSAQRELALALQMMPAFYPADAALGYLELAGKDARKALPHFDRALEYQHDYVPALVGRGQALLALDRDADALGAFEAAVAADRSLTDLKRRIEVLRFRGVEQNLAAARAAARAGKLEDASRAYATAIASSPDSAFLYRELAGVERQNGQDEAALGDLRKAADLDPSDAISLAQIGDLLAARGDLDGSIKAYSSSLAIEWHADIEGKLERVRARAELARLPEEYRAIEQAPQITRADLAALIGVRLAPLLQTGRPSNAVVITDIRNNWAANWILTVARAGVMEPFANHTFQPRAIVRRADLAQARSRLLTRIAAASPARAKVWQSSRLRFADVPSGHLAYPAASLAVASGVMKMGADNTFQPSAPVSGADAMEAVARIETLAGTSGTANTKGQR